MNRAERRRRARDGVRAGEDPLGPQQADWAPQAATDAVKDRLRGPVFRAAGSVRHLGCTPANALMLIGEMVSGALNALDAEAAVEYLRGLADAAEAHRAGSDAGDHDAMRRVAGAAEKLILAELAVVSRLAGERAS